MREPAEVGSAANSYEILAKLAMGGMAEIFLARGASAAGIERYVVLKRVLRHRASDVHFVQMFLDEARLAAQLQHPNIAQVYDIGKLGDSFFFTMEYVHGETVRNLLARSAALRRPIPVSSVLSIIAGAAAGLQHAHERKGIDGRHLGIVHRDVSPSNLMVSYEGTVKVVDFGVAKAAHQSHETMSGTVKGKISYMSPEQCKGSLDIDRRCDLFSLGIVMWEVLTTEKLFRRTSDFETMQAIVSDDVPPPSRLRPDVPPEIDHIVRRLLNKDPAMRYQTADELHEAIENVAVRTGSALSAASLGRYMRELFGQRPEPWIELAAADQHPEAFTVTSEPIPNNLALSPAEEFDRKLSAVPALTQRMTAQTEGQRPPAQTVPLRIDQKLMMTLPLGADPAELFKTQPKLRESQSRIRNVVELPIERRTPTAPPLPASNQSGSMPMLPHQSAPPGAPTAPMLPPAFTPDSGVVVTRPSPSVTPLSNPHYPIVSSSSHQAFTAMPPSYPVQARQLSRAPAVVPRKRSRALLILGPAIVLGSVIGVALAVSGKKQTGPEPVADEAADTEMPAGETTTMVAAPETHAPSTDQPTQPTAPEPTVPPKGTSSPGGSEAPEPKAADAKPAEAPTQPADTASDIPSVDMTKPDKPKPERGDKSKPDVAAQFKAGNFGSVMSACGSASTLSQNTTVCVVAACKLKQSAKAKKWFKQVSDGKKAGVIKDCEGVIPPERPASSTNEACKTDPMACQH